MDIELQYVIAHSVVLRMDAIEWRGHWGGSIPDGAFQWAYIELFLREPESWMQNDIFAAIHDDVRRTIERLLAGGEL